LLPLHPFFCALCIIDKLLMPNKKAYCFDNMKTVEISHTSWKRCSTWASAHIHMPNHITHHCTSSTASEHTRLISANVGSVKNWNPQQTHLHLVKGNIKNT
jgi:hypothetical protein